jgi:hypothetical protein
MLGRISAILVVLLVPALAGAGDLTPTAQARAVAWSSMGEFGQYICGPPPSGCTPLSVTPTSDGNGLVAGDFLPFSASLDGIVDQSSTIDPKQLAAAGSHTATASASFTPTGTPGIFDASFNEVESRSSYSVVFDLSEATPFQLTGEIAATSLLAASLARIRLTGPGGATLAEIELSGDGSCLDPGCEDLGSDTLDQSGTLAPGSYTLLAEVDGHAFSLISPGTGVAVGGTHSGSYDVTLTLDPVSVPSLGAFGPWLALLLGGLGAVMARRLGRHAR